jgi:uncharacterized protein YgiM (DUF1202 family)
LRLRWGAIGLIAILLAACAETDAEVEALPTRIVQATGTPSGSPSSTPFILPENSPTPFPVITAPPAPNYSATPVPSSPLPPTATPFSGIVTSDVGAFVRSGPGVDYDVVGEVLPTEALGIIAYAVNENGETWYLIQLADGRRAWISTAVASLTGGVSVGDVASAATIPPTGTATPTITPTFTATLPQGANALVSGPEGVNLRDGAGYRFDVLDIVGNGKPLVLIGRTEDARWYQAVTFGEEAPSGWVNAAFIAPLTDVNLLAVTWVGPPPVSGVVCGMNIQPRNGEGWLPLPPELAQAEWVRFPFAASTRHFTNLNDAFAFYDEVIEAYHSHGVRVILVLTHETYGENAGWQWLEMSAADWAAFTIPFVDTVEQVARHYGDDVAAYEIWNEGDARPGDAAAVSIPPQAYARLLDQSAAVIRQHAPRSQVVLGGLINSDTRYLRAVQAALGGHLPVDAVGLHPYGRGAPADRTVFSQFGGINSLIAAYERAVPGIPLWFTEIGAIGDNSAGRWNEAAQYMVDFYGYLRQNYPEQVGVAIWYGWSDAMDPARRVNGLVTSQQHPKTPIYDSFFELCAG